MDFEDDSLSGVYTESSRTDTYGYVIQGYRSPIAESPPRTGGEDGGDGSGASQSTDTEINSMNWISEDIFSKVLDHEQAKICTQYGVEANDPRAEQPVMITPDTSSRPSWEGTGESSPPPQPPPPHIDSVSIYADSYDGIIQELQLERRESDNFPHTITGNRFLFDEDLSLVSMDQAPHMYRPSHYDNGVDHNDETVQNDNDENVDAVFASQSRNPTANGRFLKCIYYFGIYRIIFALFLVMLSAIIVAVAGYVAAENDNGRSQSNAAAVAESPQPPITWTIPVPSPIEPFSPTIDPTKVDCQDSKDTFLINDIIGERGCQWLQTRPVHRERLCQPGQDPFRVCRQTCNVCSVEAVASSPPLPTTFHSDSPSDIPTAIPTMRHSASKECRDDPDAMFYVHDSFAMQTCNWLREQPIRRQRLCNPEFEPYTVCRETCGLCDSVVSSQPSEASVTPTLAPTEDCLDSGESFIADNDIGVVDCNWLQSVPGQQQVQLCRENGPAHDLCKKTCGVCATGSTIAPPSLSPDIITESFSPTVTLSADCLDSMAVMFIDDVNGMQGCAWLRNNPVHRERLCSPGSEGYILCRQTCGTCPQTETRETLMPTQYATSAPTHVCFDSSALIFINERFGFQNCEWLHTRPGHLERLCQPQNEGYVTCRQTCGSCSIVGPPPIPPPNPPPTPGSTSAPTHFCSDTQALIFISDEIGMQNCSWLQSRPGHRNRLCRQGNEGYFWCRQTCGSCSEVSPPPTRAPVNVPRTPAPILPTRSPVLPTVRPTATLSEHCVDAVQDMVLIEGYGLRSCAWLARQAIPDLLTQNCQPGREAYALCQRTCNSCSLENAGLEVISLGPTPAPTPPPVQAPRPTRAPTRPPRPTPAPTTSPVRAPRPTRAPTRAPRPTRAPTLPPRPTPRPTLQRRPTRAPTPRPTLLQRRPTPAPTLPPRPTPAPTLVAARSVEGIIRNAVLGRDLDSSSSAQSRALQWMMRSDNLQTLEEWRVRQRWSLAAFGYSTGYQGWTGQSGWLNPTTSECLWFGISCDSAGRVQSIRLPRNNLQGALLPELSLLSNSLAQLNLENNAIRGTLPTHLGMLTRLTSLETQRNSLSGPIPSQLASLVSLTQMNLSFNFLTGTVPRQLENMVSLTSLLIFDNDLVGSVPPGLCNFVSTLEADCREISCSCCTECWFQCGGRHPPCNFRGRAL